MQDEIGVQITDFIAVVALLLNRVVQHQRWLQSVENKQERGAHRRGVVQDQIRPVAG
jgi:heme exporter protein D